MYIFTKQSPKSGSSEKLFLQALTAEGSAVLENFSSPYALLSRGVGGGGGGGGGALWGSMGRGVPPKPSKPNLLLEQKIAHFAILFNMRGVIICV